MRSFATRLRRQRANVTKTRLQGGANGQVGGGKEEIWWGGAGTCQRPRGWDLRAFACWIVEQAAEFKAKKYKQRREKQKKSSALMNLSEFLFQKVCKDFAFILI